MSPKRTDCSISDGMTIRECKVCIITNYRCTYSHLALWNSSASARSFKDADLGSVVYEAEVSSVRVDEPRRFQHVAQGVVAFMTGKFVHMIVGLLKMRLAGPTPRVVSGILHGKHIIDFATRDSRETFNYGRLRRYKRHHAPAHAGLAIRREILGLDDQRVAFPPTNGISKPR